MEDREIELIDYLRVIWRQKWIILLATLAVTGLTVGYVLSRTPMYRVKITMKLDNRAYEVAPALLIAETAAGRCKDETLTAQLANWPSLCMRESAPEGAAVGMDPIDEGGRVAFTLSRRGSPSMLNEAASAWPSTIRECLVSYVQHDLELLRAALVEDLAQQEAVLTEISAVLNESNSLTSQYGPVSSDSAFAEQVAFQMSLVAQARAALARLAALQAEELFAIEELAQSGITKVGTARLSVIGIGVILGLLISVMLSFFIDYLTRALRR